MNVIFYMLKMRWKNTISNVWYASISLGKNKVNNNINDNVNK